MDLAPLTARCQYTFQTVPLPQPGPGELLIKVVAAGLCHTDLIMPMAEHGGPLPITGSHEPAGVVVALGEGVKTFNQGDRVMAVNTARGCSKSPRDFSRTEGLCSWNLRHAEMQS